MSSVVDWLFGSAKFVPHGFCLLWRPDLVAIHVVSDALIAAAYFGIPLAIYNFAKQRTDLERSHKAIALLFVAFIMACGLTHIASIVTLWQPYYGLQALVKAFTAAVSVATAAALPFVTPQLLRIPSPRALATANASLRAEVGAHQATLRQLRAAQENLERQVAEATEDLRIANARFQAALANSQVMLYEQDEALRYTWVHNPPFGLNAEDMLGTTESDVVQEETVTPLQALKHDALATGQARRAEILVRAGSGEGWFDVHVEPCRLREGRLGLIASATDITAQKRQQEHLQTIMSELNHRSKNLLTIVQSIARQTARGFDLPEAFLARFGERLKALAQTHDVLVEQNWSGADLRSVVESQLRHQLATLPDRIRVEGEPVALAPETAHYLGLAIHELGANASKYGALSGDQGRVAVAWLLQAGEDGAAQLHLSWRESGGPSVIEPERRGFGRNILEVLAPRALGGDAKLRFEPKGVQWRLDAPVKTPG